MSSFVRVRYGFGGLFGMWALSALSFFVGAVLLHGDWQRFNHYCLGAAAAYFYVWVNGKFFDGPLTAERVDLDE